MTEGTKEALATFIGAAIGLFIVFGTILLISGCAALYKPVVDYALEQAKIDMMNKVEDLIHEAATKPPPPLPPIGSSWTEYGVWGGTVAMGSLAVLVDRRRYHRKRVGGVPLVPGVRPVGPPPPMPDLRTR